MDIAPLMGPAKYGYDASGPAANTPTGGLDALAAPSRTGDAAGKPWNPQNPLFWFGVLTAVTFGFAAVGTSVRVGNARAAIAVGNPK